MIKWFAYIIVLLIFAPCLLSAKSNKNYFQLTASSLRVSLSVGKIPPDTSKNNKKQEQEDKNKIKEIAKAKKQPKPEKIEPVDNSELRKTKAKKPKRQRRPEGLERPPEIPRRSGN